MEGFREDGKTGAYHARRQKPGSCALIGRNQWPNCPGNIHVTS